MGWSCGCIAVGAPTADQAKAEPPQFLFNIRPGML